MMQIKEGTIYLVRWRSKDGPKMQYQREFSTLKRAKEDAKKIATRHIMPAAPWAAPSEAIDIQIIEAQTTETQMGVML